LSELFPATSEEHSTAEESIHNSIYSNEESFPVYDDVDSTDNVQRNPKGRRRENGGKMVSSITSDLTSSISSAVSVSTLVGEEASLSGSSKEEASLSGASTPIPSTEVSSRSPDKYKVYNVQNFVLSFYGLQVFDLGKNLNHKTL
jgi:hypothetical protein